jgi:hypothetical protein
MGFENEGRVPDDDLFPIELLGLRAQESILAEFGGRRPLVSELANLPDDYLMKLSGVRPSTVRKVRSITRSGIKSSSEIAGLTNAELLSEHDCLAHELTSLRDEFHRREHELQARLRETSHEIRARGLSSR